MDLVVAVAIAVLLIVFLASLLALVLLCVQRRRARRAFADRKPILRYSRGDLAGATGAVVGATGANGSASVDADFDDMVQLSPNIAKALGEHDFLYDAPGLVHHCLAVLRVCRQTADRLSAVGVQQPAAGTVADQEAAAEVRYWTRRVMPRVDDLVRAAYQCGRQTAPLVQASLLEARAAALVLTMAGVATAFRAAHPRQIRGELADWLRDAQRQMDQHLEALRLAAWHEEAAQRESVQIVYEPAGNDDARQHFSGAGANEPGASGGEDAQAPSTSGQQQQQPRPAADYTTTHNAGNRSCNVQQAAAGDFTPEGVNGVRPLPPTPPPPAPGPSNDDGQPAQQSSSSSSQHRQQHQHDDASDHSSAPDEPTVDGPTVQRHTLHQHRSASAADAGGRLNALSTGVAKQKRRDEDEEEVELDSMQAVVDGALASRRPLLMKGGDDFVSEAELKEQVT